MEHQYRDGARVVRMEGEMTIYQAGELKQTLQPLLAEESIVEIDLAAVTEIDSAGIQLLIAAKNALESRQGSLRLVRHSEAVIDAFEMLDLSAWFGDPLVMPSSHPADAQGAATN